MRLMIVLGRVLVGVSLISSCSNSPAPGPATGSTGAPIPAAPVAQESSQSLALTMNGYKRDVAKRVYAANAQYLFEGQSPPLLKSIVVLSIRIDGNGKLARVSVLRSNGYKDLEVRAMQSLRDAAPLPMPNRLFMQGGGAEFVETWLFRDDGRFQIRSLGEGQASE
jgi:protein TonB